MRLVFSAAAGIFAVLAALLLAYGGANAAPLPKLAMERGGGLVHQVKSGCGWDYACPPRPDFRRKTVQHNYVRGNQFTIENYGRVQIYYNEGRGHFHRPHHPRPHYNRHRFSRDFRGCRDRFCNDRCGPGCWYRKFKSGHCGHGCGFYRERVRWEDEIREVRVRRPVYYNRDLDVARDIVDGFPERRRADRPYYPDCAGPTC